MRRENTVKTIIPATLALLLALAISGLASRALAQGGLGSYLEAKGGLYSPSATFTLNNIDLETGLRSDTRTGVNGELAIGHFFLPTLAGELGIGYFKGDGSIDTAPPRSMDFNVIPVVATAKAFIPMGRVNPYAEAGLGVYFTSFDASDNGASFSGTSTLGLHAGAGVNVNVSRVVFLGLEGRYVSANPSVGDQKIKLNDAEYALNGFKLNGFTTTLGVGYNF
jgi:outer membrane protein W